MIANSPSARNPGTAMRDLLRELERKATSYTPARPGVTTTFAALRTATAPETRIGSWVLTENEDGDLVATHDNGTSRVLATPEVH